MYNAGKFAVVGLTAATRREYAAHGVSVTAVLPTSRKGEIAVPGYVLDAVRRLVRDDRALRPDTEDRAGYRARLRSFTD